MRHLFGTDGIRGIAGEYPLDQRTTHLIGRALGHSLAKSTQHPHVVIGEDTRESSYWIAASVAAGLQEVGGRVHGAGVITTPGVAYLARTGDFAAGIVISASHNPWQDNGIKVFAHDGFKLADEAEVEIEHEIFSLLKRGSEGEPSEQAALSASSELHQQYVDWLTASVRTTKFSGLRVVVDTANGAASVIAPEVFRACGIQAEFIFNQPNGRNINRECGAMHAEAVARATRERGADLGVTFDGDADRALFADARGNVVNGDAVMLLAARDMQARGTLRDNTVVATTMSNMGLEAALSRSGIRMLRAPVGDKYVLEEMRKTGAALGGEQSGHVIFRDGDATTGDGLLTALRVLEIVAQAGKPLAELIADLKVFPQTIKNVRVREKKPLSDLPEVAGAISAAERDLDGTGRVVVRYSGTEALARVMIEAESEEKMKRHAEAIAAAFQRVLGV
ncbi:MAG: phosphoglucosamine mutase [Acidobacteriales bacterium]|nr:phosphoglucosamine mutase [Terriglobales bacterium]